MAHLAKACPILAAPDVRAAAEWYRDKLGFSIGLVHDAYAIVVRDGVELHFWACEDRAIAEATSAYVRADDIEGVHERCRQASEGGRLSAIEDREWGMREFYVWDPAGNLIRFGEPVRADDRSASDRLASIENLPPEEFKRQIAEADAVIREGRL